MTKACAVFSKACTVALDPLTKNQGVKRQSAPSRPSPHDESLGYDYPCFRKACAQKACANSSIATPLEDDRQETTLRMSIILKYAPHFVIVCCVFEYY